MGPELGLLDDHDLLAGGVADGVAEARAGWQRWARLVEFHRRLERDYRLRHEVSPHFTLTPRAQTVSEVAALWGLSEARVRHELNVALFLEQFFPGVWELCRTGQLDCYRAGLIADHVRHSIDDPVLLHGLAKRLQAFLDRHLSAAHGLVGVPPIVACTPKQLRNKLTYELNRLRPGDAEERHRTAKAKRHVRTAELADGMAQVGITATVEQVRLAEHRQPVARLQARAHRQARPRLQRRAGPGRLLRAAHRRRVHPPAGPAGQAGGRRAGPIFRRFSSRRLNSSRSSARSRTAATRPSPRASSCSGSTAPSCPAPPPESAQAWSQHARSPERASRQMSACSEQRSHLWCVAVTSASTVPAAVGGRARSPGPSTHRSHSWTE